MGVGWKIASIPPVRKKSNIEVYGSCHVPPNTPSPEKFISYAWLEVLHKQGLVQDYSQRIEGANISGLKLSMSPGFENFNYNNALLNYNNGL